MLLSIRPSLTSLQPFLSSPAQIEPCPCLNAPRDRQVPTSSCFCLKVSNSWDHLSTVSCGHRSSLPFPHPKIYLHSPLARREALGSSEPCVPWQGSPQCAGEEWGQSVRGGGTPTSAIASLLLAPRAKAALCSAWTRPAIEAGQRTPWKSKGWRETKIRHFTESEPEPRLRSEPLRACA